MKKFTLKVWAIFLLSFLGLASANAQFLESTETVDIVQIPGFDNGGSLAQYYVADLGTAVDSIAWTVATGDVTKWYKIPAGGVNDSTSNVQAYYYKNVATGRYLYISDAVQAELLTGRIAASDWPTARAGATTINGKTPNFKWFDRTSPWPWGVYITNAAGINPKLSDGLRFNSVTGSILSTINDTAGGVIDPAKDFFGVHVPNVSVGGFKGGLGNAWTAVKTPVIIQAGVANPDFRIKNAKTVNVVQISTWMTPNNVKLGGVKPYAAANKAGAVVYSTDAAADSTKWYEIPAGAGAFENQVYLYKNVATGAYLKGSSIPMGTADWNVSAASTMATSNAGDSLKWSKMNSNWGNGPWLVNEKGNTGTKPSGTNGKAFFAFTMLTANTEFFGVDVPNIAISNPGDGGNAWTAVEMITVSTVANPDYFQENTETVNVVQISTWMTPANVKLAGIKPFAADKQGSVVYVTDAASDSTKWYEIPAGVGAFNNQVYYYKNLVTGAYLKGSAIPMGTGDWTVSAATTSATNNGSAYFKWSKMNSNWGNGPWLVNEQGNTGTKPSGTNKQAFFALTMLSANSEFFGVDVPNVAISNPADGGNAWTAVEIKTVSTGVANPDVKHNFDYSTNKLNFFATDNGEDPTAASYNAETKTISYTNGGWHRAGWNWEADGGIDVSAYNQVWIKFDGSALPKTGDGVGGATKIQFDVVYMDDTNAATLTNKSNEIRSSDSTYFYNLTAGKKIKRITLKSEAQGDLVLKDAYFFHRAADPVDLVITNFSWTPEKPVTGDSVSFKATIKNTSTFASQNVKHSVTFSVNGGVVAWSDNHLTAMAPGEEVTLTANGGAQKGKWLIGKSPFYIVKAEVNDGHDVIESDYTNNVAQDSLFNAGKPDLVVTSVAWSPATNLTAGSQITFNAKVKNIGNVDINTGVVVGASFMVDGNVVNTSDTYNKAILVNQEVRLIANSGPNSSAKWIVTGGNHTITAHVNGQSVIVESDFTNNTFDAPLNIATGIEEISTDGRVFVADGKLYIVNFPESTFVSIYNLQGVEIEHYRASDVSGLALPNNLYVLRIQDGDKSTNLKVLIK